MHVLLELLGIILNALTIFFILMTFFNFKKSYKKSFVFICFAIGSNFLAIFVNAINGIEISIPYIYLFFILALNGFFFLILSNQDNNDKNNK